MIHKLAFICLCLGIASEVFGDSDEVKSVSVMEGDSVTLHTDLTHIQTVDLILWTFQSISIAKNVHKKINMFNSSEIFGDRLKLDNQTGSLTITNIRITDSGLYKLQIISDRGTSYKRFNLTVYAPLPVPEITRSNSTNCSSSERSSASKCVVLCSVMNVSHVSLSWYKGMRLLSSISVSDLNIRLSLPLEVEYHHTNTYTCVVNNPISNKTQHLNINDVCHKCSENQKLHWIGIAVVLLILLALVSLLVLIYFKSKSSCSATKEDA